MTSNRNRSWARTSASGFLCNREARLYDDLRHLQSYSPLHESEMDLDNSMERGRQRERSLSRKFFHYLKRGTNDHVHTLLPGPQWGQERDIIMKS
jgi:hypothetical protein